MSGVSMMYSLFCGFPFEGSVSDGTAKIVRYPTQ